LDGRRLLPALAVVLALFVGGPVYGGYVAEDLGTLGGSASQAFDINDFGQITGWAGTAQGTRNAFIYSSGPMANLGTLGVAMSAPYSYGLALNNSGQVAGITDVQPQVKHAFLYASNVMTDLGVLPGGYWSYAFGINNNGDVVGWSGAVIGGVSLRRAFVVPSGGPITALSAPAGKWSSAEDINDYGMIVGWVADDVPTDAPYETRLKHPVVWDGGALSSLGVAPGAYGVATAVNNAGNIVGATGPADDIFHACFWSSAADTDPDDLGTLTGGAMSMALDVTIDGVVVGWSLTAGGDKHAVMWDGNHIFDLNDLVGAASGWTLIEARGINCDGAIVGYGINYEGYERAFSLSFMQTLTVPLPGAVLLAVLGGGLVLGWRRRGSASRS